MVKISEGKKAQLRAKREAEKAKRKKTEKVKDEPAQEPTPHEMDFTGLKVNGHKIGDPLVIVEPIAKPVVKKMFWEDEPPPLVREEGLFKDESNGGLDENYLGWKETHFITRQFFFNDFGYFKKEILSGRYENIRQLDIYAQTALMKVNDIHQGAMKGDPFENSLMRLLGMVEKQVQHVHGMEFFKMLQLTWNVGHAESKMKARAAIQKKAEDGDVESMKTVLKQEGILSVENAPSGGGDIILMIDNEDMNA